MVLRRMNRRRRKNGFKLTAFNNTGDFLGSLRTGKTGAEAVKKLVF